MSLSSLDINGRLKEYLFNVDIKDCIGLTLTLKQQIQNHTKKTKNNMKDNNTKNTNYTNITIINEYNTIKNTPLIINYKKQQ